MDFFLILGGVKFYQEYPGKKLWYFQENFLYRIAYDFFQGQFDQY